MHGNCEISKVYAKSNYYLRQVVKNKLIHLRFEYSEKGTIFNADFICLI